MMNFCKRAPAQNDETGTDIPKSARIICIIQLCFAFTVLFWILGSPFTDALYYNKKAKSELDWVIVEHGNLFKTLSPEVQNTLLQNQEIVSKRMQEPFLTKLGQSVEEMFLQTPLTKKLWLLLALILPIMVMKQVEGAKELFWLFPLLVVFYAWQTFSLNKMPEIYPSETYLEQHYLESPIEGSLDAQKEQLETAWQSYIIAEWSKEPQEASHSEKFANGLYHFIVNKTLVEKDMPPAKPGPLTLALYLLWNLTAALVVNKRR